MIPTILLSRPAVTLLSRNVKFAKKLSGNTERKKTTGKTFASPLRLRTLTVPVKDVNVIGNGPKVLSKIVMAGNDMTLARGGGTCGKNGQRVPVSFELPTVKISEITVGGA